mgnify:FL=1
MSMANEEKKKCDKVSETNKPKTNTSVWLVKNRVFVQKWKKHQKIKAKKEMMKKMICKGWTRKNNTEMSLVLVFVPTETTPFKDYI